MSPDHRSERERVSLAHDPFTATAHTRARFLKLTGLAGASTLLPGVLAACGGGSASTQPAESDDVFAPRADGDISNLNWTLSTSPGKLDVIASYDTPTVLALAGALDGLLRYDADGALVPGLAESYEQPDLSTFRFKLRPGVTFWNGDPLTVEDVVYSIERSASDDSGVSFLWGNFESVRGVGDDVVEVRLSEPMSVTIQAAAHAAGWIVQKRFAERAGDDLGSPETLTMGTGPYRIERFVPDTELVLVRNDDYWGEAPEVEQVTFKFLTEDQARLLAARADEVDGGFDIGIQQAAQWQRTTDANVAYQPNLWCAWVSLDVEQPEYADVHVRRAISHCIDREGLVKSALAGHGEVATCMVPPQQWAGLLDEDGVREIYARLPQYEFDIEKAKAELAQSRYPDGFAVTLDYSGSYGRIGTAALSLKETLAEIGIDLTVREVPNRVLNAIYAKHERLGMQIGNFFPDYPDPVNVPIACFLSEYAAPNGYNFPNYRNPQMDRLLNQYIATPLRERARRIELLTGALEMVAADVPWVPIWWEEQAIALDERYAFAELGAWYQFRPWQAEIGLRA